MTPPPPRSTLFPTRRSSDLDWIVYQAKNTGASGDNTYAGRDTRAQRFTWNADGTPNFGTPVAKGADLALPAGDPGDRKSTRLNSSHGYISYAVFCLKKKKKK